MNIELPAESQKILGELSARRNVARARRGEAVSNAVAKRNRLKARQPNNPGNVKRRHLQAHKLNRSILRKEEEIRADLAKMLGAQLQAQLIRWGFV